MSLSTLMAFLATPAGRGVIILAALMAGAAAIWWSGVRHAREEHRDAEVKQQLEQRETRDEVEEGVRREPDPARRLLDGWARD